MSMPTNIEGLINLMESRPLEEEVQMSRRERYTARQKLKSKRNSNRMQGCCMDWDDQEEEIYFPSDKSSKVPKKKEKIERKGEKSRSHKAKLSPPAKKAKIAVKAVEPSFEDKLRALKIRVALQPLFCQPIDPSSDHLKGELSRDYFKRRAQELSERKIRVQKKALRMKQENAEKAERLKRELAEDKAYAASVRKSKPRKSAKKSAPKALQLTDPAVAPSDINLFDLEKIPAAPETPKSQNMGNKYDISDVFLGDEVDLDPSFDDIFPMDFNLFDFEQQFPGLSAGDIPYTEYEILAETNDNDPMVQMILDEEDGLLYRFDEGIATNEGFDGIDDTFLAMMNDDDVKIDPVLAFNQGFALQNDFNVSL